MSGEIIAPDLKIPVMTSVRVPNIETPLIQEHGVQLFFPINGPSIGVFLWGKQIRGARPVRLLFGLYSS